MIPIFESLIIIVSILGVIMLLLTRNEVIIKTVIVSGTFFGVIGLLSGAKFILYLGAIIVAAIVIVAFFLLMVSLLDGIVYCLIRRE